MCIVADSFWWALCATHRESYRQMIDQYTFDYNEKIAYDLLDLATVQMELAIKHKRIWEKCHEPQ